MSVKAKWFTIIGIVVASVLLAQLFRKPASESQHADRSNPDAISLHAGSEDPGTALQIDAHDLADSTKPDVDTNARPIVRQRPTLHSRDHTASAGHLPQIGSHYVPLVATSTPDPPVVATTPHPSSSHPQQSNQPLHRAATPHEETSPEPPIRHRIRDGDTLRSLAQRYLGNPDRAGEIFAANRGLLQSPDLLPLGQTLVIPRSPNSL